MNKSIYNKVEKNHNHTSHAMCILFKQHFNIGSGHGCWSTSRKKSEAVGRVGDGWIPSCSEAKVHRALKARPPVELGPDGFRVYRWREFIAQRARPSVEFGAGWIQSCSEARVHRAKSDAVGRVGTGWILSFSEARVHRARSEAEVATRN